MSTEEQNTENVRRPTPYTEKIQERPERNPPLVYVPLAPKEFFEKYRDSIDRHVRKVWSKTPDDHVLQPFQSRFNYYDYGGQYNFICELPPDGRPTYVTVTEPFEKEDGDLANNEPERRRRVIVSAS